MIVATGDLTQFSDRFGEVAPLGGVPHRGAVEVGVSSCARVDMPRCIEDIFDYAIPLKQ
jgi:hypothetical protein